MKTDGKPFQVSTQPPQHPQALPRLPHERDESEDSQQSGVRAPIRQAFDDIMSGQQDTDLREGRGVEEVVREQREALRKVQQEKQREAQRAEQGVEQNAPPAPQPGSNRR